MRVRCCIGVFMAAAVFAGGQSANAAWDAAEMAFSEMNCVACHSAGSAVETRLASRHAPLLGQQGIQLSPQWVRDFLVNPQAEKPGTMMPDMLHGLKEAEKAEAADALTHYLISLQPTPTNQAARIDPAIINTGKELYHKLGCVACHAPLELPAEPAFEPFTNADLTKLAAVSVPLGDLVKKYSIDALSAFLRDPLKTRPSGRMPSQRLTGAESKAIAMYLLGAQPLSAPASKSFVPDSAKAARGRELFVKYNCGACHDPGQPVQKALPFEKLAGNKKGCLATKLPEAAPAFAFTESQRQELRTWLSKKKNLSQPLSPADQVKRTMTALNCYACHGRDSEGSPTGLRQAFFRVNGKADLGEEGALPPRLNGVGAKLKSLWLAKVLNNGASVRPYMATRMPQFGTENVQPLIAAFEQADAAQKGSIEPAAVANNLDGLRLVGTEGLSCILCHVFAGHPSLGVPAVDLITAPERLNGEWFRRYLIEPAKLRPGTRMPSFWPEGVAANKTILNGDTEKQIGAIWGYLSSGKAAVNLPPGLIPAKMELVPKTEPLVYRNFIEGAGTRAIAVGYPERVNLAFDANDMNVPLLWQGAFIDASRHRTGRGEGFEPPLGYNVFKFTAGAPLAVIADTNAAWPKVAGPDAGFHFRGYAYDDQRHPQFHYRFGETEVEDIFLPAGNPGRNDFGFHRRLVLRDTKAPVNLWFRAAVGKKIESPGNNTFVVDGSLHLAFSMPAHGGKNSDQPPQPQILVRSIGGKSELLVPVIFESGEAEIVEDIAW